MLLIELNVSGWRSPNASLLACSASSSSGLASFHLPMSFRITPILLSSTDVPRSASGSRLSAASA
eukprot:scaffold80161_cov45-Phaeocystis_antarctica.AAC.2